MTACWNNKFKDKSKNERAVKTFELLKKKKLLIDDHVKEDEYKIKYSCF